MTLHRRNANGARHAPNSPRPLGTKNSPVAAFERSTLGQVNQVSLPVC